ncbi:MAG: hypothetical protein ABSC14_00900 [Desulfomonilia bacterium]|jgi:hypothetical protein
MDVLKKILNGLLMALFVEAILFTPFLFMILIDGIIIKGDVFGTMLGTWKYTVPFLVALIPYIIVKKTKPNITPSTFNIALMLMVLVAGSCFLVYFSGLILISCAGHPPY